MIPSSAVIDVAIDTPTLSFKSLNVSSQVIYIPERTCFANFFIINLLSIRFRSTKSHVAMATKASNKRVSILISLAATSIPISSYFDADPWNSLQKSFRQYRSLQLLTSLLIRLKKIYFFGTISSKDLRTLLMLVYSEFKTI